MTPQRWQQVDTAFQEAAELTVRSRRRFLDARCAEDRELRDEVESLLAADRDASRFVEGKFDSLEVLTDFADGTLPSLGTVGEYRLVRLLGTGGMGSVYLGERADGEFQQQVAIKLVRGCNDPRWAANRFKAERRILARLQHPNIARLLGGGNTRSGAPYLVMEFVDGEPLHRWLGKRNSRSVHEILQMFLALCDAVSYAHRNLIVHRDIKPGNILIQADGSPKLLDFGISKPVDDTGHSTVTLYGAMTPAYASPEQLRGEFVSTSTDVYSLGAVLYEALAGHTPFRVDRATPAEIERLVCESTPAAIDGLADDLGKIVAKAMHRSPERRYSSVEQFAEDIRRYLAGKPVTAQRDSVWYRTRKFVGRHRVTVGLSAVAMGLLGVLVFHLAQEAARLDVGFKRIRKIANASITDLPEKIEHKSAAEIRLAIAQMYDRYSQPLADQLRGTPGVAREVALGYEKLGYVLGVGNGRASGFSKESRMYFDKAIALLEPTYGPWSRDAVGKAILARSYCGVGQLQHDAGESPREWYAKCFHLLDSFVGPWPQRDASYLREYIAAHLLMGDAESDGGKARRYFEKVIQIAESQRVHKRDGRLVPLWEAHGKWRLWRLTGEQQRLIASGLAMQEARGKGVPFDVDDRILEWRIARDLLSVSRRKAGSALAVGADRRADPFALLDDPRKTGSALAVVADRRADPFALLDHPRKTGSALAVVADRRADPFALLAHSRKTGSALALGAQAGADPLALTGWNAAALRAALLRDYPKHGIGE